MPRQLIPRPPAGKLAELYATRSVRALSRYLGVSYGLTYLWLTEAGVQLRPRGRGGSPKAAKGRAS